MAQWSGDDATRPEWSISWAQCQFRFLRGYSLFNSWYSCLQITHPGDRFFNNFLFWAIYLNNFGCPFVRMDVTLFRAKIVAFCGSWQSGKAQPRERAAFGSLNAYDLISNKQLNILHCRPFMSYSRCFLHLKTLNTLDNLTEKMFSF